MKKIKKEIPWRRVLTLGVVAFTLLIWGQSLMPKKVSQAASNVVQQVVVPNADQMTMEDYVQPTWWSKYFTLPNHPLGPTFFIRKGAHLAEFMLLGALWCACGKAYGRRWIWLLGLPTGVIDECLQLISNRGALVADVVIDVAGYLIGCGLVALIALLWRKKKK